jgi:NitT/TauT family transport system substrate-binding protein
MMLGRRAALALPALFLARPALIRPARAAGETLRLGLLHTLSPAPFYLAQESGFWTGQGLEVEFRFFEAAQPIAAAAVAGDIDLGVTALTGGFFALAGKGALKVIGGAMHEEKGYPMTAFLVSRKAFEAGLDDIAKMPGHSFGLTQFGSSFHYMMGRLAQARGFELKSVTLRALQSIGNMLAALRTGQVDATMAIASMARPLIESGEAKLLGWVGDEVPYQITALFAPGRSLTGRAEALRRFCAGYRQGVAQYREAFLHLGADGKPVYGPATGPAVAAIGRYVYPGDPAAEAKIKEGVGWYDRDGALDVADVRAQLAWFTGQGLVKGAIDPDSVIDTGFLPSR